MTPFASVITTYTAVLFVALTAVVHPAPKLLWNASASVPIGLYAVRRALPLHVGELVIVTPPEPLAQFLAVRHYLPLGVPLLKHVLALSGQTVCRNERAIIVDDITVGEALDRDRFGRALPDWQGCRALTSSEVFVMNTVPPDSLDGRYFGPLPLTTIVGQAEPIWTRPET
jgi:conjugative transfer signal peptidase TraF